MSPAAPIRRRAKSSPVAKRCGVNRVSINPQSTSDAVLARIGRRHTAADFFRAVETAHRVRFGCLERRPDRGLPGDTTGEL